MKEKSPKSRIQLEFSENFVEEMDQTAKRAGLNTRTEMIKESIGFYTVAVDMAEEGKQVGFMDKDGNFSPALIPSLESIRRRAKRVTDNSVNSPQSN